MKTDPELHKRLAAEVAAHKGQRIFSFIYQGHKIWVKQAEKVRHVPWLKFARAACLMLHLPMLQPGADTDGARALRFERGRLTRLRRRGVNVPEVYDGDSDWLAISDAGRPVSDLIGSAEMSLADKEKILQAAARELAKLHALKIHHGRPALKDMLWDGEHVTITDFEDGIMLRLNTERRLARDLLLFTQSIIKEGQTEGPRMARLALAAYKVQEPDLSRQATVYLAQLRYVSAILSLGLRHCGEDLESIYQTLLVFQEAAQAYTSL